MATLPPAGPKVAQAVVDASAAAGLDAAETAATAAAVSAAVSAAAPAAESLETRVAQAAEAAGLSGDQAAMIKATLRSVDPSHWDAILNAWSAVASKKATASTAEEKANPNSEGGKCE